MCRETCNRFIARTGVTSTRYLRPVPQDSAGGRSIRRQRNVGRTLAMLSMSSAESQGFAEVADGGRAQGVECTD